MPKKPEQYIALLRGINVGGHRVKMPELRAIFSGLGFQQVESFIASGNLSFEAAGRPAELQKQIEQALETALGYAVPTCLRTRAEIAAIAEHQPFGAELLVAGHTLSVIFLLTPPAPDLQAVLKAAETAYDRFQLEGQEIYWLCQGKTSDSLVNWKTLNPQLPQATVRNATTVRKLAAKYPAQAVA